jgi:hypothetical protein
VLRICRVALRVGCMLLRAPVSYQDHAQPLLAKLLRGQLACGSAGLARGEEQVPATTQASAYQRLCL